VPMAPVGRNLKGTFAQGVEIGIDFVQLPVGLNFEVVSEPG